MTNNSMFLLYVGISFYALDMCVSFRTSAEATNEEGTRHGEGESFKEEEMEYSSIK